MPFGLWRSCDATVVDWVKKAIALHVSLTWVIVDVDNGWHLSDVIMSTIASQITSLTSFYSTVYSGADKKKTSKLRVTGLCAGKFPAQMASNAEDVSIWWRHYEWSSFISSKWTYTAISISNYFAFLGKASESYFLEHRSDVKGALWFPKLPSPRVLVQKNTKEKSLKKTLIMSSANGIWRLCY